MASDWPDSRYQPTISHSSITKFRGCDRAYALQYHHSVIQDIPTRYEHKREARLQPLNCFPGSVFHETIQSALMNYQRSGTMPADLMTIARSITREYILFSRKWVADVSAHPILGGLHKYWPSHDYAQPVESFYYDGDFPPNYRTAIKEKLERWFERFQILLPTLPFSDVPTQFWIFPKQVAKKVPWFVHNNEFAVYGAFDFLTKTDDLITIYDWKTGMRHSGEQSLADQLLTYASYAIEHWSVSPQKIRLYGVWIEDSSVQEVECDPLEINRIEKIWETHQRDWANRLREVSGNAQKLYQIFPMTSNLSTCARCSFRSCPGRNRAPMSRQAVNEMEFGDEQ